MRLFSTLLPPFAGAFAFLCGCNQTVVQEHDAPPQVSILFPADEAEYDEGDVVDFQGRATDDGDVTRLVVSWTSNLVDEPLNADAPDAEGVLAFSTASLVPGINVVTVKVVDGGGGSAESTISVVLRSAGEMDADSDGFQLDEGDCDDSDPTVYPGAPEEGNGVDDDCDGVVDEGTVLFDDDGDGTSEVDGDCDDGDPDTHPGAIEACDGADNDCDVTIDEDTPCSDDDGDGFSENGGDCDDANAAAHPGASEIADGVDNDCDGWVDEDTCAADYDLDGYCEGRLIDPSCPFEECLDGAVPGDCNEGDPLINPSASETCDGVDNDCDGDLDEAGSTGCVDLYFDLDGDGFGIGDPQCLCSFTDEYTALNGGDCYDYNPDAQPGQLSYFPGHRGDGSWDYNCDGTQQQEFTDRYDAECGFFEGDLFGCYIAGQGWEDGIAPGCGDSDRWIDSCTACSFGGCDCGWFCCDYEGPSKTQACR